MAEEVVVENNRPSESSDLVRKIVAAVVGVIIIIVLVLLAKWLGDRVRQRFFPAKVATKNVQIIPPEDNKEDNSASGNQNNSNNTNNNQMVYNPQTGTYVKKVGSTSTLPATGPNDMNYLLLGSLAVFGLLSLTLAKRFSL